MVDVILINILAPKVATKLNVSFDFALKLYRLMNQLK